MSKNTTMNIRMDSDIKIQAEKLFSEIGINMTTAINMFLRESVREQRIPLELSLNIPNAETLEAIREVELMKENPLGTKSYTNVDEMMKDLLS